jgi:hypothetical protein
MSYPADPDESFRLMVEAFADALEAWSEAQRSMAASGAGDLVGGPPQVAADSSSRVAGSRR